MIMSPGNQSQGAMLNVNNGIDWLDWDAQGEGNLISIS